MNSPEAARHCVAICQLSNQRPEDFNVNTELLVLENGESMCPRGTPSPATADSTSTS